MCPAPRPLRNALVQCVRPHPPVPPLFGGVCGASPHAPRTLPRVCLSQTHGETSTSKKTLRVFCSPSCIRDARLRRGELNPPRPRNNRGSAGRVNFFVSALVFKKQKNLAEILQGFASSVRANKETDDFSKMHGISFSRLKHFTPPARIVYHTSKSLSREKRKFRLGRGNVQN